MKIIVTIIIGSDLLDMANDFLNSQIEVARIEFHQRDLCFNEFNIQCYVFAACECA